jgi:hypothetical protein
MTSVVRRYDQQPERTRYLIGLQLFDASDVSAEVYDEYLLSDLSGAAFNVPAGTFGPSEIIADVSFGSIGASPERINQCDLYLDLGRSLHVYDQLGANAIKRCTFRQVIKQYNFQSEGISNQAFYIKTWSAQSIYTGTNVPHVFVARTG